MLDPLMQPGRSQLLVPGLKFPLVRLTTEPSTKTGHLHPLGERPETRRVSRIGNRARCNFTRLEVLAGDRVALPGEPGRVFFKTSRSPSAAA